MEIRNLNNKVLLQQNKIVVSGVKVGDSYLGGIVMYIWSGGTHGFVVSTTDQFSGGTEAFEWGANGINVSTSDLIGSGPTNNANILAADSGNIIAARIATNKGYGWVLPSKNEMTEIYNNKSYITFTTNRYYWTSSQVDTTSAWRTRLTDGLTNGQLKTAPTYVRPIKYF